MLHTAFVLAYVPSALSDKISRLAKTKKEIVITVQNIEKAAKEKEFIEKNVFAQSPAQEQFTPPPYTGNIADKLMVESKNIPSFDKPQVIENHPKEIFISEIANSELIRKTPSYMNYYNSIRAKIYNIGQRKYSKYKIKDSGEVSLNFIIFRDGKLEYVEGQAGNERLKELALKIIRESSPFMPFPEELKGHSCPFSIVIDFKSN